DARRRRLVPLASAGSRPRGGRAPAQRAARGRGAAGVDPGLARGRRAARAGLGGGCQPDRAVAVRRARRGLRRPERRAALVLALFVLVLVVTAGMLASLAYVLDRRSHHEEIVRVRLSGLTDSAITEALAALDRSRWARGFAPHPFGGGVIAS